MKTFLRIFLLLFATYDISFTQPVIWQRYYDNNSKLDAAGDVIQTFDGGYIIAGSTDSPSKIYLIKINYLGIKEWEKIISDSIPNIGAYSIKQTKDSGYIMTGDRANDIYILKTNRLGDVQWKKYFNRPGGDARSFGIHIANDNGYIIGGDIFFLSLSSSKSYIIKTDSLGNLVWEKLYGDSVFTSGTYILTDKNYYYFTNTTKRNFSSPYVGMCYK